MYPIDDLITISDDDDESVVEIFQNIPAPATECKIIKTNTSVKTPIVTNGFKNVKNELNGLADDDESYNFLMQELSDLINSYKSNSVSQNSLIVPETTEENVESNQKNDMGEENNIQIVSVESLNHRINQWMDTSVDEEFVPQADCEDKKAFEGDIKNFVANNDQHEFFELKNENSQSGIHNDPWMKTPMKKLELEILNKYLPIVQLTRISLPKNDTNSKNFIKEQSQIDTNDNDHDLKPLIHQNKVEVKQEVGSKFNPLNDVNQGVFICKTCVKTFNSRDSYQEHINNHNTGNKCYKCDDCDFATDTYMLLRAHRWTHAKERPHRCSLCEYGAKRSQSLNMHVRRIHTKERPFVCPHSSCMYAGSFSRDLKNHLKKQHPIDDTYNYTTRSFKADSLDHLSNHRSRSRTHSKRNFSRDNLKDSKGHKEIYLTAKMYPCTYCSFSTPYKNGLKYHLSKHETVTETFKCDACGNKFINKDQHIRNNHTPFPLNKVAKCSFCQETFKNKYNMKLHLKTHANKNLRKCRICLYTTSIDKKLRKHMNDHKNNRLFTCNDCNKSFRSKMLLRQHFVNFHYIINHF